MPAWLPGPVPAHQKNWFLEIGFGAIATNNLAGLTKNYLARATKNYLAEPLRTISRGYLGQAAPAPAAGKPPWLLIKIN